MSVGITLLAPGATRACLQVRAERWSVCRGEDARPADAGVGRTVMVAAVC